MQAYPKTAFSFQWSLILEDTITCDAFLKTFKTELTDENNLDFLIISTPKMHANIK